MNDKDMFFDKVFNRAFGRIEDYRFRGYNNSLGCFVEGKEHYKRLLKKKGLVPFDEANRLAQEFDKTHRTPEELSLSPKAQDIISSLKLTADRNGNIRLGDRAINALREIGAIGNNSIHEPCYTLQGGFSS
jgi:hypothetical protein